MLKTDENTKTILTSVFITLTADDGKLSYEETRILIEKLFRINDLDTNLNGVTFHFKVDNMQNYDVK